MNKHLELLKETPEGQIGSDLLVNIWLEEFFDTTIEEAEKNYKKDKKGGFETGEGNRFYNDYKVTEDQHDWWVDNVKEVFYKKFGKRATERSWWSVYLNTSPTCL